MNSSSHVTLPQLRAAGVLLLIPDPCNPSIAQQFLLMRHADRWDLPKGHADPGETFLQTAMREMNEETGIDPSSCRWLDDFQFDIKYEVTRSPQRQPKEPAQTFLKHVRYFLAWVNKDVKISTTEHASFQWFDWNPPHRIQSQTIDPLLHAVEVYFQSEREIVV